MSAQLYDLEQCSNHDIHNTPISVRKSGKPRVLSLPSRILNFITSFYLLSSLLLPGSQTWELFTPKKLIKTSVRRTTSRTLECSGDYNVCKEYI